MGTLDIFSLMDEELVLLVVVTSIDCANTCSSFIQLLLLNTTNNKDIVKIDIEIRKLFINLQLLENDISLSIGYNSNMKKSKGRKLSHHTLSFLDRVKT